MPQTIAEAVRAAWKSRRVEVIAGVADGLRLQHGFNYAQIHMMFCEYLGRSISLAEFDAIMYAADEGYTGVIDTLNIRQPATEPDGRAQ